eukprot:6175729-Pleurochrysis_carterae.AAC.2
MSSHHVEPAQLVETPAQHSQGTVQQSMARARKLEREGAGTPRAGFCRKLARLATFHPTRESRKGVEGNTRLSTAYGGEWSAKRAAAPAESLLRSPCSL